VERTIRVIRHVDGPLKDTVVEVVEDDGGALRLVTRELHVSFEGDGRGTVEDITPPRAGPRAHRPGSGSD
jgi:hypothetical protein